MRLIILALTFVGMAAEAAEIRPDELAHLPSADVVILGEVHDNPAHHINQALAVAALQPVAIVFEMLTAAQAEKVSADNRGTAAGLAAALGWEGTGWPEFALYFPIFEAAPKAQIIGGNRAKAEVRRAVKDGAAAVFGAKAVDFGLAENLPEGQQTQREQMQMTAHCDALPESLLAGMVEAQRLRDATLAAAVLAARKKSGGLVVVITGNGHARKDWGMPALLRRAAPDLTILSIGQFELAPWEDVPFDFHLLTVAADRPDPCEAFR